MKKPAKRTKAKHSVEEGLSSREVESLKTVENSINHNRVAMNTFYLPIKFYRYHQLEGVRINARDIYGIVGLTINYNELRKLVHNIPRK